MAIRPTGLFSRCIPIVAAITTGCLAPDAIPGTGAGTAGDSGSTGTAGAGGSNVEELAWAQSYGSDTLSNQRAWSVATTAEDALIVAGEFQGSLTLGALPPLPNTAGVDSFVAELDAEGLPQWSFAIAGVGDQRVYRALPTPDGGFVVAGSFTESLFFNSEEHGNAPVYEDGFVARFDAEQALKWLVRVDGSNDQAVHGLALGPSDSVVVAGYFEDTLHLKDIFVEGDGAGREFFVASIDAAGVPKWAVSLGGEAPELPLQTPACFVAVHEDGNIHVAGTFAGTLRLKENLGAIGVQDLFVGELDSKGDALWGHAMGAPNEQQQVTALALSASGRSLIMGDLRGDVDFDAATTLKSYGTAPDAFLAVYGDGGSLVWARRYGSKAEDHGGPATFDAAGDIVLAGRFRGAIDFGGGTPLLNTEAVSPNDDIFLAKLAADGEPLFSAAFGRDGDQVATAVAVDADANLLLAGYFGGIVNFGAGDLDAKTGDDVFVAKFGK